ncbi:MAG TPA: tRNA (adenosine(37)-N6)-threonylcarbamoyltransferase complex ATPase subunit type 1 TsaE [Firmicutes bacterium]|nr:tRNA (adenosine(37)-N6)-threonylcarbamoyltransferase complex ATPase subunit type 1 TsaE [Bacillota bacterium]
MEAFLKNFKMIKKTESGSPVQTAEFAGKTAAGFSKGSVIAFCGELGAGKTHFIKGMAAFFGIDEEDVISPTFGIVKEYTGGKTDIYHFDFYRIEAGDELEKIGFRDYISDEEAITAVEWPERAPEFFDIYTAVVVLKHKSEDSRIIEVYERV